MNILHGRWKNKNESTKWNKVLFYVNESKTNFDFVLKQVKNATFKTLTFQDKYLVENFL